MGLSHWGLHRLVHKTAWNRTRQSFKDHPVISVGGIAGCIVLFVYFGPEAMMQQAIYGIAAAFVAFLVTYLRHHVKGTTDLFDRLQSKNDELEGRLTELGTPTIKLIYRERDDRYLFSENGSYWVCFELEAPCEVQDVKILCTEAISLENGTSTLAFPHEIAYTPFTLSTGVPHPVRIVSCIKEHNVQHYCRALIPYQSARAEALKGNKFSMKIVATGKGVATPTRANLELDFSNNDVRVSFRDES